MRYVRSTLLAIVGICCFVVGIQLYNKDAGYSPAPKEYGGDAYTGIQNAAAATAEAVNIQSDIIAQGLGSIMIFGGMAMIVCAIPVRNKQD